MREPKTRRTDRQGSKYGENAGLVLRNDLQMRAGQSCQFAVDKTDEDGKITRQYYSIPFDPELSEQLWDFSTRRIRQESDCFGISKRHTYGIGTLPKFQELPLEPPKDQKLLEQAYLALHCIHRELLRNSNKSTSASGTTDRRVPSSAQFVDGLHQDPSILFNIRQQVFDDLQKDAIEAARRNPTGRSGNGRSPTTPETEHTEASMYMKATGSREHHSLQSVLDQLDKVQKTHEKHVKESKLTQNQLERKLEAERVKNEALEQAQSTLNPDRDQRAKSFSRKAARLEQMIADAKTREEELTKSVGLYKHQRDMLLNGTARVKQKLRSTREDMRKQDSDMQRRQEWAEYARLHHSSEPEFDPTSSRDPAVEELRGIMELQTSLARPQQEEEEEQGLLRMEPGTIPETSSGSAPGENIRAVGTPEMSTMCRSVGSARLEHDSDVAVLKEVSSAPQTEPVPQLRRDTASSIPLSQVAAEKAVISYARSELATPRTGHFSLPPDLQDISVLSAMYQELEKEPFVCDHLAELLYSIITIDSAGLERRLSKKHKFYVSSRSDPLWPARTIEPWENCYVLLPRDAVTLLCPHGHPYTSRFYWADTSRPAYADSPVNVRLPGATELSIQKGDLLEYAHGECIYAYHDDDRVYCCVKTQSGGQKGYVPSEFLIEAEDTTTQTQKTFCRCSNAQPYTGRALLLQDIKDTAFKKGDRLEIAHRMDENPAVYCVKSQVTQLQGRVHRRYLEMLRNPLRWVEPYGEEEPILPLTARQFDIDESDWILGEEKTFEEEIEAYNASLRKLGKPSFSEEAITDGMRRIDRQDEAPPAFTSSRRKWRFWSTKCGGVPDSSGSFWHEPHEHAALPAPLGSTLPGQSMQPAGQLRKPRAWSLFDTSRKDVYKRLAGVGACNAGDLPLSVQHADGRVVQIRHGETIDDTQSEPDIRVIEGFPRGRFPVSINRKYLYEKVNGRFVCRVARSSYDVNNWSGWTQNGGHVQKWRKSLTYGLGRTGRNRLATLRLQETPFPWGAEYCHLEKKWPVPYRSRSQLTKDAPEEGASQPPGKWGTDVARERQRLVDGLKNASNLDQVYVVTTDSPEFRETSQGIRRGDIVFIKRAVPPKEGQKEFEIFVERVWDVSQLRLVFAGTQFKTSLGHLNWLSPMLRTAVLIDEPERQVVLLKNQLNGRKWLCLSDRTLRTIASEEMDIEDPQHWQLLSDLDYDLGQATERLAPSIPTSVPSPAEWRWLHEIVQEPRMTDGPDLDVEIGEFVHIHFGQNREAPILFCFDVRDDNQGWVDADAIDLDSQDQYLSVFSAERFDVLPKGRHIVLLKATDDYLYCACEDLSQRWFKRWDLQLSEDYQVVDLQTLLNKGLLVLPTSDNTTGDSRSSSLDIDSNTQRAIDAMVARLKSHEADRLSSIDEDLRLDTRLAENDLVRENLRESSISASLPSAATRDTVSPRGPRRRQDVDTTGNDDRKTERQDERMSKHETTDRLKDSCDRTSTSIDGPDVRPQSTQYAKSERVRNSVLDLLKSDQPSKSSRADTRSPDRMIQGGSGQRQENGRYDGAEDVTRQGYSLDEQPDNTHEHPVDNTSVTGQSKDVSTPLDTTFDRFLDQVPALSGFTNQQSPEHVNSNKDNVRVRQLHQVIHVLTELARNLDTETRSRDAAMNQTTMMMILQLSQQQQQMQQQMMAQQGLLQQQMQCMLQLLEQKR